MKEIERLIKGCGGTTHKSGSCWIWRESFKNGYGQLTWKRKNTYAHRMSYEVFNRKLDVGELVCHKCNNRQCINPEHLYAGDKKTNAKDMIDSQEGGNQHGRYTRIITIEKDGTSVQLTNISGFARDNGLRAGNLNALVNGKAKICKGWRLVNVN